MVRKRSEPKKPTRKQFTKRKLICDQYDLEGKASCAIETLKDAIENHGDFELVWEYEAGLYGESDQEYLRGYVNVFDEKKYKTAMKNFLKKKEDYDKWLEENGPALRAQEEEKKRREIAKLEKQIEKLRKKK